MSLEHDKRLVRRAQTYASETGRALRRSLTYEMAEQLLAAAD